MRKPMKNFDVAAERANNKKITLQFDIEINFKDFDLRIYIGHCALIDIIRFASTLRDKSYSAAAAVRGCGRRTMTG